MVVKIVAFLTKQSKVSIVETACQEIVQPKKQILHGYVYLWEQLFQGAVSSEYPWAWAQTPRFTGESSNSTTSIKIAQ